LFILPGVRLFLTIFFFNSSSIIPPFHVSNIQSEPQGKKGTKQKPGVNSRESVVRRQIQFIEFVEFVGFVEFGETRDS
jgi:hypothetical protein